MIEKLGGFRENLKKVIFVFTVKLKKIMAHIPWIPQTAFLSHQFCN